MDFVIAWAPSVFKWFSCCWFSSSSGRLWSTKLLACFTVWIMTFELNRENKLASLGFPFSTSIHYSNSYGKNTYNRREQEVQKYIYRKNHIDLPQYKDDNLIASPASNKSEQDIYSLTASYCCHTAVLHQCWFCFCWFITSQLKRHIHLNSNHREREHICRAPYITRGQVWGSERWTHHMLGEKWKMGGADASVSQQHVWSGCI